MFFRIVISRSSPRQKRHNRRWKALPCAGAKARCLSIYTGLPFSSMRKPAPRRGAKWRAPHEHSPTRRDSFSNGANTILRNLLEGHGYKGGEAPAKDAVQIPRHRAAPRRSDGGRSRLEKNADLDVVPVVMAESSSNQRALGQEARTPTSGCPACVQNEQVAPAERTSRHECRLRSRCPPETERSRARQNNAPTRESLRARRWGKLLCSSKCLCRSDQIGKPHT